MTFRTDLLKNVVLPLLKLPGPPSEGGLFDVYTYSVTVRSRAWSGGEIGLGTATVTDLAIPPRPRVEERTDKQLFVGPIVPSNPKGGYTVAQLRPDDVAGTEYFYLVTGANGARAYVLTDIDTSRAFTYYLTLTSLERGTPF